MVRGGDLREKSYPSDLSVLSLWQLADLYDREHERWPLRVAAEAAFSLAMAIKRESDRMGEGFRDKKDEYTAMACRYAKECLEYAKRLPAATLCDVAPIHTSLAGVTMPNYFYPEYITNRMFFPVFAALLE